METNKIIYFIEDTATEVLRQKYASDDSVHIAIEGLNLCFNGDPDYKVIVRCCINNLAAIFEIDSVIGLPNNPYYFLLNIAISQCSGKHNSLTACQTVFSRWQSY